jgi:hypothetical protein
VEGKVGKGVGCGGVGWCEGCAMWPGGGVACRGRDCAGLFNLDQNMALVSLELEGAVEIEL